MSKHTPGPWIAEHCKTAPHEWAIRGHAFNSGYVAVCHEGGHWQTAETTAANARLIAAAPLLLEAARGVLEMWDCDDEVHSMQMRATRMKALCTAITAAEGDAHE